MNHVGTIIATVITSLLIIGGTFLVLYFMVWKKSETETASQGNDGSNGTGGDPVEDPIEDPVEDPVEEDDTTLQKDDSTTVFDVDDLPDVIDVQGDDMDASQIGLYQVTNVDDISWTGTSWDTSSILKVWKRHKTGSTVKRLLILYQNEKGAVNWYITHTDYSTKYLSDDISQTVDPLTTTSWTKSDGGSSITITLTDISHIASSTSFTVSGEKTNYNGTYTEYTMDGTESWAFDDGTYYIAKVWKYTDSDDTDRFGLFHYDIGTGTAYLAFMNHTGHRKIFGGFVSGDVVSNGVVSEFGGTWTTDEKGTDPISDFTVTELL